MLHRIRATRRLFHAPRDWLTYLATRAIARLPAALGVGRRAFAMRLRGRPDPVWLRPKSSDWLVALEVLIGEAYQPAIEAALAGAAGRPLRIIDLGANVGFSVRYWQQHCPRARIVAVEPDAENLAMLRRNTAAGPAPDCVTILPCGVGPVRGKARLVRDASGDWGVRTQTADAQSSTPEDGIDIVPLADVIAALPDGDARDGEIDLLKCDIEGAEAGLMRDCAAWIGRVRVIVIETHPPYSADRFFADLARAGWAGEVVCDRRGHLDQVIVRRRTVPVTGVQTR